MATSCSVNAAGVLLLLLLAAFEWSIMSVSWSQQLLSRPREFVLMAESTVGEIDEQGP